LMKFAQARDVIYDYIATIKICQFANWSIQNVQWFHQFILAWEFS
jgi:hypothetical protein